jgi:tetratricopeptide (TPR) repeat protein
MSPANPERRRLAPPWALALFGAAALLLIVVIFTKASMFQQLGGGDPDKGDSVRVLLLRSLLAKGEKGFALRRDYIRQLGLTGDYAGAFAESDRLAAEGTGPRDSLWMLEVETASWALSAKRDKDGVAAARLRAAAESLWKGGAPPHLAWAAGKAGAAGAFDLAGRLYLKAAAADSLPAAHYRRAAEMFSAAGDCQAASEALFAAQDRLAGEKDRKAAFLDALRALQACGRLDEALAAADRRMGGLRSDTEVLLFLVHLAQSADRPRQAQHYAQLLVKPVAAGPEP